MDSQKVWEGQPSQKTNIPTFITCTLLAAGIIFLGLASTQPLIGWAAGLPALYLLWSFLDTWCEHYILTEERLILRTGVLSQRIDELELYRVKDYVLRKPFFLRLVGLGSITLVTSDRTNPVLMLRAIENSEAVKSMLREQVENLRRIRGVREFD